MKNTHLQIMIIFYISKKLYISDFITLLTGNESRFGNHVMVFIEQAHLETMLTYLIEKWLKIEIVFYPVRGK